MENAVMLADAGLIQSFHLGEAARQTPSLARSLCSLKENHDAHIAYVYRHTKGDTRQAAQVLGVSVGHLQRKLAEMRRDVRWKALIHDA